MFSSANPDRSLSARLLRPEAPVAATFSQLVRDAICRLPNLNRGTAPQIAVLVEESSYIGTSVVKDKTLLREVRRILVELCKGPVPFVIAEERSGPDGEVIYQYAHIGKTRKQLGK